MTSRPATASTRAVLSIGSNMDDRLALLRTVVDEFAAELVAVSPVYATPPWGVEDQAEFYNAVLIVDVAEDPYELLARAQRLEQAADRVRVRKWGPRTLDVDLIQVHRGGVEVLSDDPVLTLPHPFAHERAFVLLPWSRIDPEARLGDQLVIDLLAGLKHSEVDSIREVGALEGDAE
ncbi:2-amino-4-hydroxy-6-hydroxymethyldihydropteridine diphosphokinase [Corynebacterium incognita]|uniref:2-amino-4-hydroxy-6-hydroxymethyldihydropteridine diphosphokinase n=1 Tax=Corynebacterium incognita TaxID=2754725 RepID=A0A7G7CRF2_9CORY|nr:2-amino-4-hydroxy-6-hydroxymethyldihydropteridine diphosphokinase [Corynebacterium incognita]QNE90168.1 2-amino-4-hydroxy-6-hydroxymethyldihydropteridine diphosphokinase [Corynebacterium incognita]